MSHIADCPANLLKPFGLEGIQDTGRNIGVGAFATIEELEFRGLRCAGKKIHNHLYDSATPQEYADMVDRLAVQCELLSRLRHPCIVLFLGVHFEGGPQLPTMVMERLHTTLSACLHKYGVLPEEVSYRILRDVALGLCYLHEYSPPIVHGEIAAINVLLASNMNAKLSYQGVAKILNLKPAQLIHVETPTNPYHLPPEVAKNHSNFTVKADIFSYGVLMVHVLAGRWQIPLKRISLSTSERWSVDGDTMLETERFSKYLVEIGPCHPLMGEVRSCLGNNPSSRPEALEILSSIKAAVANVPRSFQNKVDVIQQLRAKVRETEQYKGENEALKSEIESLRSQLDNLSMQHATELTPNQPHLMQPEAKLTWRWHRDHPAGMDRPQSVFIGGKVFVGGGFTENTIDPFLVFQYEPEQDVWVSLQRCPVRSFSLNQFQGQLITVGGLEVEEGVTDKLYSYNEDSKSWESFLTPMLTPRYGLSVVTTQSAIVTIGGVVRSDGEHEPCADVEVYAVKTSLWHAADPLPVPSYCMSSILVGDTCYVLGGESQSEMNLQAVICAKVSSIIKKATAPPEQLTQTVFESVWKAFPNTPLMGSTAASIGGSLMAIGGFDKKDQASVAVYVYLPKMWVRVASGDLPTAAYGQTAVQLSDHTLLVCGGSNNDGKVKGVFSASIVV